MNQPNSSKSTIWDAVATFCSRHNISFRVVSSGTVFAGGMLAPIAWTASPWLALVPLAAAGVAISLRELTGIRHARFQTGPARRNAVWKVLQLACRTLTPSTIPQDLPADTKVMRACVMRHQSGRLRVYACYNMEGDDDRMLEIDVNSGAAGHTFLRMDGPYWFDRTSDPQHPLATVTPVHANSGVREKMKSILCVPIYDPYDQVPVHQRTKIGVLCFDSDLPINEIGFKAVSVQDMASMVADLLAISLKEE